MSNPDVASSTPTKQCKVCCGSDDDRQWQCNICRNWYHPACVNIPSYYEHPKFVCPSCQPLTGALKHTYTVASGVPVSTVPLEYVNLSWSQISPVTNGPSTMTVNMPTSTIVHPYALPRNPIAPPISFVTPGPSKQLVLSSPFPAMSNLAQALPSTLNPSFWSLVTSRPSAVQSNVAPAAVSFQESFAVHPPFTQHSLPSFPNPPHPIQQSMVHLGVNSAEESNIAPPMQNPSNPLNNKPQGSVDIRSQNSKVASSRSSTRQRQIQMELQLLDEQRKLQEKEEASKREYLQKRFELLKEMTSETSSTSEFSIEEDSPNEEVNSWLQHDASRTQIAPRVPEPENHHIVTLRPALAVPSNLADLTMRRNIRRPSIVTQQSGNDHSQVPPKSIRFAHSSVHDFEPVQRSTPRRQHIQLECENNLSQSHVAARQAVSRELPVFSGSPEEWPLFYSTFNSTTEMCGYTPEENLLRLQKCLRGKVFDAVKCRLMHPANVPGIISTLKMLYSNPESIVHNLMTKISTAPGPKADRFDTIIEFALTVQNLCATIEACELEKYTYNVVLLRELVDKLPPSIKLEWAKHRRSLQVVHLSVFADWLYDLAETVCPIASLQGARSGKGGSAFLNVHSEEQSFPSTQPPKSIVQRSFATSCPACGGNCTELIKCQRFVDIAYSSKWAIIKESGICRKCLKVHNGACRTHEICGVNGCIFKHHPLLHNIQRDKNASTKNLPAHSQLAPRSEQNSYERDCNAHHNPTTRTLFRVVPVILYGRSRILRTYAFLDDGSAFTLMDEALATELDLEGELKPICLKWTGDKHRYENNSKKVELEISGVERSSTMYRLREVQTVPNLGLFRQSLRMDELVRQYHHLKGVPAESYNNIQPRLLIGGNNAHLGYPQKGREGEMFEPVATKTRLGWIIHGGSEGGEFSGHHNWSIKPCCENADDKLQRAMQKYFALDSLGISIVYIESIPNHLLLSSENERALAILKSMTRTKSGRFQTRLLWKYNAFRLPNSKPLALQRFRCLETRMKKEPVLAEVLQSKIEDYKRQG